MNIGEKIKELLFKKQLKQSDLADLLHTSKQHIHSIVSKKYISIELLEKISKCLKVPITYFFDGVEADPLSDEKIKELEKRIKEMEEQLQNKEELLKYIKEKNLLNILGFTAAIDDKIPENYKGDYLKEQRKLFKLMFNDNQLIKLIEDGMLDQRIIDIYNHWKSEQKNTKNKNPVK